MPPANPSAYFAKWRADHREQRRQESAAYYDRKREEKRLERQAEIEWMNRK